MTWLLRVLALVISAGTSQLLAQQTAPGGLDSASVVLLKPDRFVRIQAPELGRIQGNVGSRTSTELVLRLEGECRRIHLAAVDTLWVRGRHTKTGGIIGGILGLGGGILLGAVGEALCEYDCDDANYMVTGGIFGAVVGGATGAIIGAAIPGWKRVFPD